VGLLLLCPAGQGGACVGCNRRVGSGGSGSRVCALCVVWNPTPGPVRGGTSFRVVWIRVMGISGTTQTASTGHVGINTSSTRPQCCPAYLSRVKCHRRLVQDLDYFNVEDLKIWFEVISKSGPMIYDPSSKAVGLACLHGCDHCLCRLTRQLSWSRRCEV
jgi:hypothetical protein